MRKQPQTTQTRHVPSYKRLTVNTNRTSFVCGNRNGHHTTELRTQRYILSTKQYTESYRLSDNPHRNRGARRCSGMVSNTTKDNNLFCSLSLTIL